MSVPVTRAGGVCFSAPSKRFVTRTRAVSSPSAEAPAEDASRAESTRTRGIGPELARGGEAVVVVRAVVVVDKVGVDEVGVDEVGVDEVRAGEVVADATLAVAAAVLELPLPVSDASDADAGPHGRCARTW